MKTKLASTKKFVSNHKTALTVLATTVVCVAIQQQIVKGWNEFLTEHDLLDVYYALED